MAALNGPVYVQAPNPTIPRYGLFAVATGPLDIPVHARIGGVEYQLSTCALPNGYEVNCLAEHDQKTFGQDIDTNTGYPFVVYSGLECGLAGLTNWGQEKIQRYLFDQLTAGEQATVENIFSLSGFGQTTGLANNPATVNLGTATDLVDAVSTLESWLYARYGLPGVLHVPMAAAAYVKEAHLVEKDSPTDVWKTAPGTKVSFGNYAGVNPTGGPAAAGTTWVYISGQVAIWRTPDSALLEIPYRQVINRATNTIDMVLEREYVVTYDCFVAGVEATLGCCSGGG